MSSGEHDNEFQNRLQALGRAAGRVRSCLATFMLSALLTVPGVALAFQPVMGMEFMLADTNGTTLVGYGRLDEGGLEIRLAQDASEVRVIVISPDGSAQTYRGIFTDGRLQIVSADGVTTDVADALARSQQSLSLAWPDGEAAIVPPNEDAGGEGASAAEPGMADDDGASGERPGGGPPGDPPRPGRPDEVPGRGPPGDAPGPGRGPPATPPGLDGRPATPPTNLETDAAEVAEGDPGDSVVPEESELELP